MPTFKVDDRKVFRICGFTEFSIPSALAGRFSALHSILPPPIGRHTTFSLGRSLYHLQLWSVETIFLEHAVTTAAGNDAYVSRSQASGKTNFISRSKTEYLPAKRKDRKPSFCNCEGLFREQRQDRSHCQGALQMPMRIQS